MQTVERWATRSDAWTAEDDERLAELVLQHIRSGSTQLRAFEEAANLLGRTNAACGYRWNGVVRKHYREEIDAAKRDRKASHRPVQKPAEEVEEPSVTTMTSSDSMREVINFLEKYDEQYQSLRQQLEQSESEKHYLRSRVHELEEQVGSVPAAQNGSLTPEQLAEDSRTLFAIMERARKLLEPDGSHS